MTRAKLKGDMKHDTLTITGPWQRWGTNVVYYVMRGESCLFECGSLAAAREQAETTKRLAQVVPADIKIVERLNASEMFS